MSSIERKIIVETFSTAMKYFSHNGTEISKYSSTKPSDSMQNQPTPYQGSQILAQNNQIHPQEM